MKTLLLCLFLVASGLSAQNRFAALPEQLRPFAANGEICGAVSLIATRDRVIHLSSIGESDLANHASGLGGYPETAPHSTFGSSALS